MLRREEQPLAFGIRNILKNKGIAKPQPPHPLRDPCRGGSRALPAGPAAARGRRALRAGHPHGGAQEVPRDVCAAQPAQPVVQLTVAARRRRARRVGHPHGGTQFKKSSN